MKKLPYPSKLLGSLALACILLTGCSSSDSSTQPTATTSPTTTTVYTQYAYNVNLGTSGTPPAVVTEFVQHLDSGGLSSGTTAASQANFPAGNGSNSIAINPSGQFAYVSNGVDKTISQFTINSSDGSWTPLAAPGAYQGSGGPASGMIDALGRFYYTANMVGGDISTFTITKGNGALAFVGNTTSTVAGAAGAVTSLTVDPSASWVYAAATNGIYQYTINNTTGALSAAPVASVSGLGGPVNGITCDTVGHVYATIGGANSAIVGFSITPGTGALVPIAGLPSLPSGSNPVSLVYEPQHQSLYVALTNSGTGAIAQFGVTSSTGALNQGNNVLAAGPNLTALAIDPTGSFLYCSNSVNPGGIGAFSIGAGGALTGIGGAPFSTGAFPTALQLLQFASYASN